MNSESVFAGVQLRLGQVADNNKGAVIQRSAPSYAPNDQQIQVNTQTLTMTMATMMCLHENNPAPKDQVEPLMMQNNDFFASTDLAIESNDTSDVALKSPVSILFRGQHIYHQFKVDTLTMKST